MSAAYADDWPFWLTPSLAAGHAPLNIESLRKLKADGISVILNLCAEFTNLREIEEECGFEVYHLAIDDEAAPEPAELEKALEWLDEALYLGKKAFIHCRFGMGRTGTVIYAYMLRRGLTPRQAEKALKHLRSKPDNYYQWRAVRRYAKLNPPLTILKPTLEHSSRLDLTAFHRSFEGIAYKLGDPVNNPTGPAPCPEARKNLYLIEASYLQAKLDSLSSEEREEIRLTAAAGTDKCPLLHEGKCSLYAGRPMQCRLQFIPQISRATYFENMVAPALECLSRDLHAVYYDLPAQAACPKFSLTDTVSERFVGKFFHHLAALLKS